MPDDDDDNIDFPAPEQTLLPSTTKKQQRRQRQKSRKVALRQQAAVAESLVKKHASDLQERLSDRLNRQRAERTGVTHRNVRQAVKDAGLDIRAGDGVEDVMRRMGISGMASSPAFAMLKSDPRCQEALSKMSPAELQRAVQLVQEATKPIEETLETLLLEATAGVEPELPDSERDDAEDTPEFILRIEAAHKAGVPVDLSGLFDGMPCFDTAATENI